MSNRDKELERLQRIRNQQLQARDPLKKERKKQDHITHQFKSREKYTVSQGMKEVKHKWKGLMIGLIVGLAIWIGLAAFVQTSWVDLAGIIAIVICPLLGFILGSSFDWRDELRDI
jgi:hypothetical protein